MNITKVIRSNINKTFQKSPNWSIESKQTHGWSGNAKFKIKTNEKISGKQENHGNSWILKRIPELQNYRIPQRLKNSSNENGFNRVDCWLSDISRVFWLQKVKHETLSRNPGKQEKTWKTIDFEELQN